MSVSTRQPPAASDTLLARVRSALAEQRMDDAVAEAQRGLQAGWSHPLLLNLVAYQRQVEGRFHEALSLLEQARRIAPDDVYTLCAIGSCLSQQGLDSESLVVFDAALDLKPGHPQAHHGRGLSLAGLGDADHAYEAHRRAVALDPGYPDALGAVSDHALRRTEYDAARHYAQRALEIDPLEPSATLTLAFLDSRAGEDAAVAARLQRRLDQGGLAPFHLGALGSLLADALEKLDRPAEAFAVLSRANAAVWAVHAPQMAQAGVETGADLCRRLQGYFADADPERWQGAPGGRPIQGQADAHVFLMGFVRSGTTLLEQVLASHPRITALEEKPILRGIGHPLFKDSAGLDSLADLTAGAADALRADYWRRVREFGVDPVGRVFVDKNPLDVIWLPLVAKLFPDARILMARRDPRDVVVSSFKHRFMVNALTCAFTGLERTAEFYAELMALGELYRAKLPLHVHVHRHEDLVDDFDGEVRAICDFLGVEWADSLRDFAATARRRDIRTPSADQVRKGLSREGLQRWRRYAEELKPVLPVLQPWVEAFGYDA